VRKKSGKKNCELGSNLAENLGGGKSVENKRRNGARKGYIYLLF